MITTIPIFGPVLPNKTKISKLKVFKAIEQITHSHYLLLIIMMTSLSPKKKKKIIVVFITKFNGRFRHFGRFPNFCMTTHTNRLISQTISTK
jgi:hypothetical protein